MDDRELDKIRVASNIFRAIRKVSKAKLEQSSRCKHLEEIEVRENMLSSMEHWSAFVLLSARVFRIKFKVSYTFQAVKEYMSHHEANIRVSSDEDMLSSFISEFCNLTASGIKNWLISEDLYQVDMKSESSIVPELVSPDNNKKNSDFGQDFIHDKWCYVLNNQPLTCDSGLHVMDWDALLNESTKIDVDSFVIDNAGMIEFFD